ncbi:MarR family winged helix-turn-helix transcriptional regulator [Sphingomonas bisphenolicum]|jgi:DNA-binding MarR family transcriptional regulator|uniref:MarR family winged helix-turn-helix transcriptional regulator n=1 Tax=Novosphingobium sp. P6W TaxID=1609758 RepID=UPI0006986646|nr:MarR family transcriptional regulator [Novosphingobium sp. P6W]AXB78808.1 MarR family transcriptional regulator [Novosphingobium sp. P6W]
MSLKLSDITGFSSSYDVLGYLLRLMSSIWHRQLNAELARIDLTEMQFVLMIGLGWLLESNVKGVTQRELAEACGVSTALASQVMKPLTKKGLVDVGPHATDARARVVSLSPSGEEKLKEAAAILRQADEQFRADNPKVFDKLFKALREAVDVKMTVAGDHPEDLGAMPR